MPLFPAQETLRSSSTCPVVPCHPVRSWQTRRAAWGLQPLSRVRRPLIWVVGAGGGGLGSALGLVLTCLHDPDHLSAPPADLNGTAPELPVAVPSGPFRHTGLSKAARTHRLRKLRSPAKCRECNSYVYFQGAECEEVSGPRDAWGPQAPRVSRSCPAGRVLRAPEPGGAAGAARSPPTPRPTVLPGLPQEVPGDPGHPVRPQEASGPPAALRPGLQPGGPRHPGRRALHPQEVHLRDRAAGAAHQGALGAEAGASPAGCGEEGAAEADCGRPPRPPQGIYRVNGVKTRVEKLCQAFENGKELVELSQASPHDISNVLKLYLRQVSPRAAGLMVGQPGGRGRGRCRRPADPRPAVSSPSRSCPSASTTSSWGWPRTV